MTKKLSEKYKVEINGAEILTDLGYLESYPIVGQDFIMTNGLAIYNNPEILNILKSGQKPPFLEELDDGAEREKNKSREYSLYLPEQSVAENI